MEPSIWATQKQWKEPFKESSQTPLTVNGKKSKEQSSRIFTSTRRIKPRNTEDSHWTYLKTTLRSLQPKVRAPHLQRYMNMLSRDWGYRFHNGVNHKEPLKSQEKEEDQAEQEHQELAKILTKTANLTLEPLKGLTDLKGLEDLADREDQVMEDREDQEDRVVEDQEDLAVEDQEDLVVEDQEGETLQAHLEDLRYLTPHNREAKLRSKPRKHLMEIDPSSKISLTNCFYSSWETLPSTPQAMLELQQRYPIWEDPTLTIGDRIRLINFVKTQIHHPGKTSKENSDSNALPPWLRQRVATSYPLPKNITDWIGRTVDIYEADLINRRIDANFRNRRPRKQTPQAKVRRNVQEHIEQPGVETSASADINKMTVEERSRHMEQNSVSSVINQDTSHEPVLIECEKVRPGRRVPRKIRQVTQEDLEPIPEETEEDEDSGTEADDELQIDIVQIDSNPYDMDF
ncbi:hypothetical protein GSI_08517 [Ganoderma sinense ZZ0214-1]|uniref:Uncharacterized protein n=1 Tax=Ganoderma sinense ZZ0214-1 TaxID=1077348 RepID=A0A2G8S3X7_9APHY|nr:hypothetical protein GSI_08517 [Ganoderma sinense ZZ0214-1]